MRAGGNEVLGEPSASMRKDEIARLFLQSENLLHEIAACHRGFGSGPQDGSSYAKVDTCRLSALQFVFDR